MFSPQDFQIVDAHCHPFAAQEENINNYDWRGSMDEFDREMHELGIDFYVGNIVRRGIADFSGIRKVNREELRLRDRYPAYIPGIHLLESCPQESCRELHEMVSEGVRWIGEILPYLFGPYDSPQAMEIWREAEKLGIPVNFHVGRKEEVEHIVACCPALKIVLAHPGETWGENTARERLDLVASHPNLYLDISGTGLFRWGMLRYAVDRCGADRILFGTDMPVCSPGMNLYGALCEHLTKEEFQQLFSGNFKRLTGVTLSLPPVRTKEVF